MAKAPQAQARRPSRVSSGASRRARPRAWGKYIALAAKVVLGLGSVGVLIAAVIWVDPMAHLRQLTNRPIAGVAIEGPFEYLSQQKAQALLADRLAENFLQLDMVALKEAVEENPWVDKVTVSRQWPDRLVVRIQEQQPIARWGDSAFVNMRGDIIHVDDNSKLSHLPLLHGRDRFAKDVMQNYVQMARLMGPAELGLEALYLDDTLAWSLQLQGGIEIKVGRDQVFEKLQRLLDIFPRELAGKMEKIASIDLRYDNGFAVAWKESGLDQVAMAGKKR